MNSMLAGPTQTVAEALPEKLFSYLRGGALGIVMTVGSDQYPTGSFAWVVAVDQGGKTSANLGRTDRAALQLIGADNLVYLVKGECRLIAPQIAAAPNAMALWEMVVVGAKDQSWPGAAPLPLAVQWYGLERERMVKTEQRVFEEMRQASSEPAV